MNRVLTRILAVIAVVGFVAAPRAQAGRPFETTDTGTADRGAFELELGTEYAGGDVVDKEFAAGAVLTYGLLENMEVAVATGGVLYSVDEGDHTEGWGDSCLECKWRIAGSGETVCSAALKAALSLPTGDASEGFGSDEYDGSGGVAVTFCLPGEAAFNVNAIYNALQTRDDTAKLSAEIEGEVADGVLVGTEFVTEQSVRGNRDDESSRATVGTAIDLREDLTLDLGLRIGLDNRTPEIMAVAGCKIVF